MKESQLYHYDKVLNAFDLQIKEHNDLLTKLEKQLFKLSINLTVYDWKLIRGKDYFDYTKRMSLIEKRRYLLELIHEYKKNK
jgi:hypothetical protein